MQLKLAFIFLIGILLASDGFADPFDGVNAAQNSQDCTIKLANISRRSFTERALSFNHSDKKIPLNMNVIIHSQKPGFTEFNSQSILEMRLFNQWLNRYVVDGQIMDLDLLYANKEEFDPTARMIMVVKKDETYSVQMINEVTEATASPSVLLTTKDALDFVKLPRFKADMDEFIIFGSRVNKNYFILNIETGQIQKISMKKFQNGKWQAFEYAGFYVVQMAGSKLAFKFPKN